jgi:hypothetical protein
MEGVAAMDEEPYGIVQLSWHPFTATRLLKPP